MIPLRSWSNAWVGLFAAAAGCGGDGASAVIAMDASEAPDRSADATPAAGESGRVDGLLLDRSDPRPDDGGLPDVVLPDVVLPDVVLPDAALLDRTLPDAPLLDVASTDAVTSDVGQRDGGPPIERGGFCSEHWCWSNPLPQGARNHALWVSPRGRIWAGGAAGSLMTFDGNAWSPVDLGTMRAIGSIWGSSDDDVWVTDGATLWHFDGLSWRRDTIPSIGGEFLQQISGTARDDVWLSALPLDGQSSLLHYDGRAWKVVPGTPVPQFMSISAVGPTDVWLTGGPYQQYVGLYHWDGKNWKVLSTSAVQFVWASGPDDIWLNVSGNIMRNSGAIYMPVSQGFSGLTSLAPSIAGSSANDVWAIGDRSPLVNHWNGAKWTIVDLQEPSGRQDTSGVASAGRDEAVVSGERAGSGGSRTRPNHFSCRHCLRTANMT